MINKKIIERGSTKNSNGTDKDPDEIHSNTFMVNVFCPEAFSSKKARSEIANEASTAPHAIPPDNPLLNFFPNNPLIRNPIKGNSGTRVINLIITILILQVT